MNGFGATRPFRAPSALRSYRRALRAAVGAGAKAYGFTLVIWTTGALTVTEHGLPRSVDALAFLGGALLAEALTIVVCFGGLRSTWGDVGLTRRAYGAIHLGAVALAVVAGWLVAATVHGTLGFFGAALTAVVIYNFLLALEVALSIADVDMLRLQSAPAVPGDEEEE